MTCQKCGCSPCACGDAVLSGVQLVNSLLTNPTIDGGTINSGTANDMALVGATLDCTSRGCTAGVGVCNDGLATNAQVCASIAAAISSSNPAFCVAVGQCVSDIATFCVGVAACISSEPGIINVTSAFGASARATTALYGVTRYATSGELANAVCLVAVEPCSLSAFWTTPSLASPLWAAFNSAVMQVITTNVGFCPAVLACGVALLASPAFTGTPTAPTAGPLTNTTQIATTAFVQAAAASVIPSASCAQLAAKWTNGGALAPTTRFLGADCFSYTPAQIVVAGLSTGGPGTVFASGYSPGNISTGCSMAGTLAGGIVVTFTAPQPDLAYGVGVSGQRFNGFDFLSAPLIRVGNKSVNGFVVTGLSGQEVDVSFICGRAA